MVAAAVSILTLVKNADLVTIEAIEAVLGAHPDIPVTVLRGGIAAALRKSLPQRTMLETDGLVLGKEESGRPYHHQHHKT